MLSHCFQGALEGQAKQKGGNHPVSIQSADPALRSASEWINPTRALHAPIRASKTKTQKSILRLLPFIPFPVEVDTFLRSVAEQLLAHRVHRFEMNRFHKLFNS